MDGWISQQLVFIKLLHNSCLYSYLSIMVLKSKTPAISLAANLKTESRRMYKVLYFNTLIRKHFKKKAVINQRACKKQ